MSVYEQQAGSYSFYPLCEFTAVVGQWSSWTPWSQCSLSCGPGLQSRYRFCSSPQRSRSGLPCVGAHREDRVCISSPCDREFMFTVTCPQTDRRCIELSVKPIQLFCCCTSDISNSATI